MREVIIVFHNHVDPVWARGFEESVYNGKFLTRGYMEIFDWMVDSFMNLEKEGFHYSEGQVLFWEKYLERHPDQEENIRRLVREGKLEFLMQGYLNSDTNYIPAEGIVRNFLLAQPFYKKYGEGYPVNQGFLWDEFGSSANLPQILKQFGANRVGGTKYRPCLEKYWVGIDGSKLPCIDEKLGSCNLDTAPILYVCARHPHCPKCGGYGCKECEGRGMINRHPFRKKEVLDILEQAAELQEDKHFILIGGEEVLPDPCITQAVAELNEKHQGEIQFRFGTLREYWECFGAEYEKEEKHYGEFQKDLNPVNQGGYLTRIEEKQRVRKAVYAMLQAEAAYAATLFQNKEQPKMPEQFEQAWKYLVLNMHHDAISGAHVDGAHKELMSYLKESEQIAAQYYVPEWNGHAVQKKVFKEKDQIHYKKLGRFDIAYDLRGMIHVLSEGEDVFGNYKQTITAPRTFEEPVRIGELFLQDDFGDVYGTYLFGEAIGLGQYHYGVMEEERAIIWRGNREVCDPAAPKVQWETRVEISEDGNRLNFTVKLDTDMENKRISVWIPVNDPDSKMAVYEIPFGFLEREFLTAAKAQEEIKNYFVPSLYEKTAVLPTGDYPTLHWIRHDITEERGVAVLNKGLPCNRYEPGCIVLGLIRTPQMQGVTVMPNADEVWDIQGAKSAGEHEFEFSVFPYYEKVTNGQLTRLGYRYNNAELPVPFQVEGELQVTAFKVAEDEKGFILRVFETEGKDSEMKITYTENHRTSVVMANEEEMDNMVVDGKEFHYQLHKHEILTLRIQ